MILFTSDWHLQTSGMFARPTANGLSTRAEEGLDFIRWLKEYVRRMYKQNTPISAIVHCGDMFTQKSGIATALYNTTLDALGELTEETCVDLYYMPGNHDLLMKTEAKHFNMYAISKAVDGVFVVDENGVEIKVFETSSLVELFGVHPPFAETDLPPRRSKTARRLLIVHENIVGGQFESGALIEKGVSQKDLRAYAKAQSCDAVFGGDIHQPQKILGKPPIYLVGAPFQFNFGDNPDRGFWLYDPDKNVAEFQAYPDGPKYLTLTDADIEQGAAVDVPNTYLRLRVSSERGRDLARAISKDNPNVRLEYSPGQQDNSLADIGALVSPGEMIRLFVESVPEKTKKEKKELITLGNELIEGA